jgi:hypothetical protein
MVYDSSLIGSPDASDASSGDDASIPPCDHAEPPGRPTTVDDGGSTSGLNKIVAVAAFNTIDIGVSAQPDANAAIPPFGYDLDNRCTCPGPASCLPRTGASPGENCDDVNGRDHQSIVLFQLLQLVGGAATTGTKQVDQGLMAGQYGLLIRISNWNGKPNDPRVTVDFYVSNGLERDDAGGIPTPKLDGTDRWTIDPTSIQNGDQPQFSDMEAYVTGGTFVANFPELPIVFGDRSYLGGATMQLLDAVVVGTLQLTPANGPSGVGLGITSGTIAGRWPTGQILATMATIPGDGGFLCGTDPNPVNRLTYGEFKAVMCNAADISKTKVGDNTSAPCDAISVGMQFTAVPAVLGNPLMVAPAPAGCVDAGADGSAVFWSDQCSP